jgi:hypothetical protein
MVLSTRKNVAVCQDRGTLSMDRAQPLLPDFSKLFSRS